MGAGAPTIVGGRIVFRFQHDFCETHPPAARRLRRRDGHAGNAYWHGRRNRVVQRDLEEARRSGRPPVCAGLDCLSRGHGRQDEGPISSEPVVRSRTDRVTARSSALVSRQALAAPRRHHGHSRTRAISLRSAEALSGLPTLDGRALGTCRARDRPFPGGDGTPHASA